MSPAWTLLVTHRKTLTMKYYVLFTLMTSGPSSQWCESYRDFLIAIRTHRPLSSLCASAYITHSAQTASHIFLFTTGKLPPFHKQEDCNTDNQTSTYPRMLGEMQPCLEKLPWTHPSLTPCKPLRSQLYCWPPCFVSSFWHVVSELSLRVSSTLEGRDPSVLPLHDTLPNTY